jgi:hypothetical protein
MEGPIPSNRRSRRWHWLWLLPVATLFVVGWKIGNRPPGDLLPSIYLHPDGSYTFGARDGKVLFPHDLQAWKNTDIILSRFILDLPPQMPLENLRDILNAGGGSGIAHYQLRVGRDTLNFKIPGSPCCSSRGDGLPPEVIDLRKELSDLPEDPDADIHILADDSATFEEIHAAALPHLRDDVTMVIECFDSDGETAFYFIRDKGEDRYEHPKKAPESAWDKVKRSVGSWLD